MNARREPLIGAVNDSSGPSADNVVWVAGCTGTLVSANVVLTAGHCIALPASPTGAVWETLPAPVAIGFGNTLGAWVVPLVNATESCRPPGAADVILLRLPAPVSPTVAVPKPLMTRDPLSSWCVSQEFWADQTLRLVGWGLIEGGIPAPIRRQRFVRGAIYPDHERTTFSNPQYFNFAPGIVQSGDSGSPLLWVDPRSGREYVIGVCQGTASTTVGGLSSYVATFAPAGFDDNLAALPDIGGWLENTLRRGAASPGVRRCRTDEALIPLSPAPLRLFWSEERGDHLTASTPRAFEDARSAGYQRLRGPYGYVFTTHEPGTVPLKLFWHSGREDNFSTATQDGERAAVGAGYDFVRIEGYVYPREQPGTIPLRLWWNGTLDDNATALEAPSPDYVSVRTEGFVLDGNQLFRDLTLFWSADRSDNFSTATPDGARDAAAAGYVRVRDEARVFARRMPGTWPIRLYWHPERRDNYLAATAEGQSSAEDAGYTFVRVEGYVRANQAPGTVPLKLFWNSGRLDNFTTASTQGEADAEAADYTFVRNEGFVDRLGVRDVV